MIQSKNEYPNYYFRNIKSKNKLTPITAFKNPFESIKNVHKEVIKYKRKDGVELSGTLYLPAGYDKKKKEKLDEVDLAQMSLFDTVKDDDILEELKNVDLSNMTPIDALNKLYELQNKIKNRW